MRATDTVPGLDGLEPDDKLLCLKLAIKTADLSYLSKGHDYVQVWTDRVLEEFFAQVTSLAQPTWPRTCLPPPHPHPHTPPLRTPSNAPHVPRATLRLRSTCPSLRASRGKGTRGRTRRLVSSSSW